MSGTIGEAMTAETAARPKKILESILMFLRRAGSVKEDAVGECLGDESSSAVMRRVEYPKNSADDEVFVLQEATCDKHMGQAWTSWSGGTPDTVRRAAEPMVTQ